MKVGILSDTHDNLENVRRACDLFAREGVTLLLHCGDVCGSAVVEALDGFTVYFALGNMDRVHALGMAVDALQGGRLARLHELTLAGKTLALLHGDDSHLLQRCILSGTYAYVVHGHTHRRRDDRRGTTRIVNPGALGGVRLESRSIAILDLTTDQLTFHTLP
ncbi:MAG: YfcE family phosphodiesterase [Anaerolineae bacterium]|nr:YfcE family phosphodiesterase [Anaerolineae bacterium]